MNEDDAVILEAGNGTFYYADLIEKQGAKVYIINPRKFKIIKDSWQKTDKHDARNMAEALWVSLFRKKSRLPLVYKPDYRIRELRRILTQYQFVNKHIVSVKNMIQSCFSDVGIVLKDKHRKQLFTPEKGYEFSSLVDVNGATRVTIKSNLDMLYVLLKQKENLFEQIIKFGEFLKEDIMLLMEIKGVSPLLALAFLAEIGGDAGRFKKVKQMNAYLGVVPGIYESGGKKKKSVKIIKASRHLARTLFTQSVIPIAASRRNQKSCCI